MGAAEDPILVRRERYRRLAARGQQLGYLGFGLAMVVFVVGFLVGFTDLVVAIVVGSMLVGSVVLLPAIIVGYAVRAADREDRERGEGSRPGA